MMESNHSLPSSRRDRCSTHRGSACPHCFKCPGLKVRLLVRPGLLPQSGPEAFAKPVNKRCYSSPVFLKVCRMGRTRTSYLMPFRGCPLPNLRPSSCTRKLVLRCKENTRLSQIMGQPRKLFNCFSFSRYFPCFR